MILMGFDVSNVPTADVMELAAKLLEVDAETFAKMWARLGASGVRRDTSLDIAKLLRERAVAVRALEMLAAKEGLDS